MNTVILTKIFIVKSAIGYKTAFDPVRFKYRVIRPNGTLHTIQFKTRESAEAFAFKTAKLIFYNKDQKNAEIKKSLVLGNDLSLEFDSMDFNEIEKKFNESLLGVGPKARTKREDLE